MISIHILTRQKWRSGIRVIYRGLDKRFLFLASGFRLPASGFFDLGLLDVDMDGVFIIWLDLFACMD